MADKKMENTQSREKYETMEITVMKIVPQGVLCASGQANGGLKTYRNF